MYYRLNVRRALPVVAFILAGALAILSPGKATAAPDAPPSAQALRELLDKQAIAEVMMTYCRALDHLDEPLLRSVFHPDSRHNHGFVGPSSDPSRKSEPGKPGDFVSYALGVLSGMTRTHHQLGNIFIEVDVGAAVAYTEAYFTAFHRLRPRTDPLASATAYDTEMDVWVGGRYMDRMEKRDNVWKITNRTGLTDWQRIESPSSRGYDAIPSELRMHQNRDDFLYHRRPFYG
jgi:hypothetical protein